MANTSGLTITDTLKRESFGSIHPSPSHIAARADFHLCRVCPYAARCWERHA